MNKANKITMSRVIMSIIIIVLLLFPFDQMGIDFPTYLIGGKILIDLKYIIVGVLFIIASFTDFLDGYIARKYNWNVEDYCYVFQVSPQLYKFLLLKYGPIYSEGSRFNDISEFLKTKITNKIESNTNTIFFGEI